MNTSIANQFVYTEADIRSAISAYKAGEYSSIRSAAIASCVLYITLYHRIARRTTRQKSYQHAQILSDAEERSLVKEITRVTTTGFQ